MSDTITTIADRYRRHLSATESGKTVEAFSRSPYFKDGPSGWGWDEHSMRLDQAALARAFVARFAKLSCTICQGCLPAGETCRACGREGSE